MYKDGSEVAWVAFKKNPGVPDDWFHPSRVMDSYLWDKNQLKAVTVNFRKDINDEDQKLFWMLSEGRRHNNKDAEGRSSAHARWVAMVTSIGCDSATGPVNGPLILYSNQSDPAFLVIRGNRFL